MPKVHTDPEVDLRRAQVERVFAKFGGDRGVNVVAPKNATFCFVELETPRQCDLALQEMTRRKGIAYRITRAKRTRFEALQEERAAAAASAQSQLGKRKKEGESTSPAHKAAAPPMSVQKLRGV
jgi:histidinol-phosphate/aromatic aminotransferase/cobyric acid decarboxylase-like protein